MRMNRMEYFITIPHTLVRCKCISHLQCGRQEWMQSHRMVALNLIRNGRTGKCSSNINQFTPFCVC